MVLWGTTIQINRVSSGWTALAWGLLVFCLTASLVIMRAFATELYRGTATGWATFMEAPGAAIGLLLVSVAMRAGFDFSAALGLMSLLAIVGAAVILAFPETGSRRQGHSEIPF